MKSQNFSCQNIYEVMIFHKWINELFSGENKVPEHCLKLKGWQGPPHVNEVKRCEIVLSFKSWFIEFQSVKMFLFWLKVLPQNYWLPL